jgi:hypothetical protein
MFYGRGLREQAKSACKKKHSIFDVLNNETNMKSLLLLVKCPCVATDNNMLESNQQSSVPLSVIKETVFHNNVVERLCLRIIPPTQLLKIRELRINLSKHVHPMCKYMVKKNRKKMSK